MSERKVSKRKKQPMNDFRLWAVALAAMLVAGCASRGNEADDSRPAISPLPMPIVPQVITDPTSRAEYAATHFWNALTDTTEIDTGVFEQDVANFAAIASLAGGEAQRAGWLTLWRTRGGDIEELMPVIEDYLWEPESPVYLPDLFAAAIDAADSLKLIPVSDRLRMVRQELRHNEPGTPVDDFMYVDRRGPQRHLRGTGRSQLLIIYDPECSHCAEEMSAIAQSPDALASDLAVVAIYPGSDYPTWRDHAATLPPTWTVGMNREHPIGSMDEWTVRTTPQFYLIDRNDTVVWRGVDAEALLRYMRLQTAR